MIEVKELIVTTLSKKGTGKDITSPIRSVFEIYTKEGQLLAFHDSIGNFSVEDLISFGKFCILKPNLPIEELFNNWKT